ncbi:MAG TPA: protein-disulfide reductase DsbD domain-containing protein [Verrucomicrobiae bacterium]|nr:protein-disulfide reductase DsbD domain-containing protein [Verrucomicrobiae bacterium]
MRFLAIVITVALGCLGSQTTQAAHTAAQLILSADTAKPGDTVMAAVRLQMDPGWHTYWKNGGDAGIPTKIVWQLPAGVTNGEIEWPLPEKLGPAEVTTYGYEGEAVLLVPLHIDAGAEAGTLAVAAKVSWLECQDVCIPAGQDVTATLNIGPEAKASAGSTAFAAWKANTPSTNNFAFRAWWEAPAKADERPLIIGTKQTNDDTKNITYSAAEFFPDASDPFEIQPATEVVSKQQSDLRLRKTVKKFSGDWPKEISGLIVTEYNHQRTGFNVTLPVEPETATAKVPATNAISTNTTAVAAAPANFDTSTPNSKASVSLGQMLLYAFIGGLILNIMPCVLPVIALKILGFVSEAKSSPRRVRALGGIYAIGVLFSFLVLAGVVIALKGAGRQAGWGMQFANPIFLVSLTTLVTLVALNLFGVFEVTLGGGALDKAGELASQHGAAGAFFNGVLATALATPCTAPFLSIALGFAFAQSAAYVVLIFLTVGLGLAAPYILLSWNPAWLKFLPKPGAWMEKFKIAMGFPMLATVVWLFNIAGSTYGKNVLWLGVFLVSTAFAAWVFGEFVQRGRSGKTTGTIIALVLLLGGYAFALEKELDWRHVVPGEVSPGSLKESADGIDWQPWSPEAVKAAQAAGKVVLVDFTADWCLTCQVNKKTSIEIASVRKQIKDLGAVAFVGDYTHTPDNITTELKRYDRAGVPLVLVFPKSADAAAIVLPEVLTPGIVLTALDQAAK